MSQAKRIFDLVSIFILSISLLSSLSVSSPFFNISQSSKIVFAQTDESNGQPSDSFTINVVSGTECPGPSPVPTGTDDPDTIYGTNDGDVINGGDGDDNLFGCNGSDNINGDGGNDVIEGGNEDDIIDSGDGNDNINGGNGNDDIIGGAGNDIIDGGQNGNDIIQGGSGNDKLTGGNGADRFDCGEGTDVITDFNASEGDTRMENCEEGSILPPTIDQPDVITNCDPESILL